MIEYLGWDSDFFGFKTGLLQQVNGIDMMNIFQEARNIGYHLIYLFTEADYIVPERCLLQFNGKLVDKKVIFKKELNSIFTDDFEKTTLYLTKEVSSDLLKLAFESGKYSRFKTDTSFAPKDFSRLYSLWIENSVNGKIADEVFVIKDNQCEVAMITLKQERSKLEIGLIATLPEFQGLGYGKQLISRAIKTAIECKLSTIEVSTQLDNHQACKFYKASGFNIKSVINIYHFWL